MYHHTKQHPEMGEQKEGKGKIEKKNFSTSFFF